MSTALRDASRSRAAILDAAESVFAERGFTASSLGEIASAAGLSRATPSYFFGSKDQLYTAVLQRVFEEREAATERVFQPVMAWARQESRQTLSSAMTEAVSGYVDFLQRRPAFVRLIQHEGLSGGERLHKAPRRSRAMSNAFEELHSRRRELGLNDFRVDDAVLILVSLTFSPLTQQATFMTTLGRNLGDARTRREHVRLVVSQLSHLMEC
jgi:TetR/AcrR family transcriptional regulator